MINNRAIIDTRKVLSGKDGGLFSLDGTLLASCETYQAQVNVTNAKYQPLGDAQEHEVFTGFGVTLNFTEIVVEDEQFLKELVEAMQKGEMPIWNFQGVLKGRNGTEERMIYRQVVPSGTIDLQNVTVGDVIKRAWSMFVNEPPELQSFLTA